MVSDPYMVKAFEYLLGVVFLLLFVGFWQYATGGKTAAKKRAAVAVAPTDMFRVPADVMLHPGHGWARLESPGVVLSGIDQFAQQLLGKIDGVHLPSPGDPIRQGERAWSLETDSTSIDMLAPVSGRVLAVNDDIRRNPALLAEDPYGRGWLIKVQSPRFDTCSRQLLRGGAARHLMTSSWEDLANDLDPDLGAVLQDGGMPVHGLARAIDENRWDAVARRALRSEGRES